MLTPEKMTEALNALNNMTPEQLLEINKSAADLYKMRRRQEGRQKMNELKVGTRVILSGVNKPAYLNNQLATIEEIRQTRVVVKLDRGPMGKFKTGRVVLNPALLTVLKNQPTDI